MKTNTPLTESPAEAKHNQIYRALLDEILSGKFVALGPFPSERALMRRFGVARETIRQAVRALLARGLVYKRQGKGTFLADGVTAGAPAGGRKKIGLLVSGCRHTEIFLRISKELARLAEAEGVELLVGDASSRNVGSIGRQALKQVRLMIGAGVAGLIVQPLEYGERCQAQNEEMLAEIERAGVPLVLIDSDVDTTRQARNYDIVSIDNFAAGASVSHHLRERGAAHVRFLVHDCLAESIQMRLGGCRIHLREENGPLLVQADPSDERQVRALLAADPEADAFVCQNDIAAVKLIATLRRLGRRVPEDLMVAGFDDVTYAVHASPALTTVHQPCEMIAGQALHLLLKRMERPGRTPCRHLLHAPLVIRGSTERVV